MTKILILYLFCGFLPLMLAIGIFYNSMKNVLLEDAYDTMQEEMTTLQGNLDQTLQPYLTLMEMTKNDKSLQVLLLSDYTSLTYAGLSSYIDDTLETMMAMNTGLTGIRFYCANPTLPDDEFYFYQLEELDEKVRNRLDQSGENAVLTRDFLSEEAFLLTTKMNFYTASGEDTYLAFQVSGEALENLKAAEPEMNVLFLDGSGTILLSEEESQTGEAVESVLPDWSSLEEQTIETSDAADGTASICLTADAGKDTKLLLLIDREKILKDVRKLPLQLIRVLLVLMALNAFIAFYMSRNMNKKLKRIQEGMHAIGSGEFQEKIEDLGQDEFGLMAQDVNRMGSQLEELIRENYEKQLTITGSELNLLQEQINPHFLYNALAVISSLGMQEGAKRTVQSIRYLADFYRISLNKGRKVIQVKEEIALLNSYMKIQLLRFSDLVEISYEVDPGVEEYYTIKLLLQPLVENAIHHAREEESFLSIKVKACERGERICFDVEDDGMGMPPEKLKQLQEELQRQEEGFGIKNVDKRIKLAYGQEYGAAVFSTLGEGTRIHLEIPKVTER